jgi:hypothetical protein
MDWSGNVHRIKGWGGRAKTKGLNTVIKTATHTKWGYRILNLYVVLIQTLCTLFWKNVCILFKDSVLVAQSAGHGIWLWA